jgi:hypothetical protein
MTIENITLAILGMEKYLGLVSLIVVAIGMQFYEPILLCMEYLYM